MEEKNNNVPYIDNETYSTDLNGYTDFTTIPEFQAPVHYKNAFKGSIDTQKIISNPDIVVSNLIRKNENGEFEFALMETIVTSTLGRDGYYGILLETPFFELPTKETLPYEEIVSILDKNILDLNLYMEGNSKLDEHKTPIHQSFTDQCGQFYVSAVSSRQGGPDIKLHWFLISSLSSYINLQLNGGMDNVHSSMQTLYALKLLERKYKAELNKLPHTEFKLDKEVPKLELVSKKQIIKNSPRFTIVDVTYKLPDSTIAYSTYAGSRDSMENIILEKDDKNPSQYNLVVSKQQRSPFVTNKEFPNGILNEFTGGMLEEGQTIEDAAIAEASQEQAYGLEKGNLTLLYKPAVCSLSTGEFGAIFVSIADNKKRTEQNLDKGEKDNSGESISSNQYYLPLKEVEENSDSLNPAPIAAKLGAMLSYEYIEKQKKQERAQLSTDENSRIPKEDEPHEVR